MPRPLPPAVQRSALRAFKKRGLTLHVGALENLYAAFNNTPDTDFDTFLDGAFDLLSRPDGAPDGILTKDLALTIADRLTRDSNRREGDIAASLEFIDIFTVPRWRPRAVSSHHTTSTSGHRVRAPCKPVCDGAADAKTDMFRARYELMLSKTLRGDMFATPLSTLGPFSDRKTVHHLTTIDSIEAQEHESTTAGDGADGAGGVFVLGLLTQFEEGAWFLEDLHGSVRIDASEAQVTSGLHTEGSVVLAYGVVAEDSAGKPLLKVKALGNPHPETREQTIRALGNDANIFGGHFEPSQQAHLLKMEREADDAFFIFFADVALDNSRVFAGLRYLFQSYVDDGFLPTVIVLMGNFLSHPFGEQLDDVSTLCDKFGQLGEMIRDDFKPIADAATFVIVPGTQDPGPGNVLPRPPMPPMVTRRFVEALGKDRVQLTSNPCRMRFLTQEIVIMRDDLMRKMLRRCVVKPDMDQFGAISEQYFKSLIDQSYLCPLGHASRPVLWRHDHAMWLYPTPHVVVVGDRVNSFTHDYSGCIGLNPGSFASEFSFQVYIPSKREGHISSIDSENTVEPKEEEAKEEEKKKKSKNSAERMQPSKKKSEKRTNRRAPVRNPPETEQDEHHTEEAVVPEHEHEPEHGNEGEGDDDGDNDDGEIVVEPDVSDDQEKAKTQENDGGSESSSEPEEDKHGGGSEDISDAESDDSVVAPAGVKRYDIKAMVQESLRDNFSASAIPPLGEEAGRSSDSDSDGEREGEGGSGAESGKEAL